MTTPAGWYKESPEATRERYWDGTQWTAQMRDSGGASQPAGQVVVTPAPASSSSVTTNVAFDKQDQFDKLKQGLMSGEVLKAVFDGKGSGTGFMGVTDRRLILQDNSFVGKKVSITSIPYHRIDAVHYVNDKSMLGKFSSSSTVAVSIGARDFECEFRGEDKARFIHDFVLSKMLE